MSVLHDCTTAVSALRSVMPVEEPDLLDVREPGETGPLPSADPLAWQVDADGTASSPVWDREPVHPQVVTAQH